MVMASAALADRIQCGHHHHTQFRLRIFQPLLQNLKRRLVPMMTTMTTTMKVKKSDVAVAVPVTIITALVIAQYLNALVVLTRMVIQCLSPRVLLVLALLLSGVLLNLLDILSVVSFCLSFVLSSCSLSFSPISLRRRNLFELKLTTFLLVRLWWIRHGSRLRHGLWRCCSSTIL